MRSLSAGVLNELVRLNQTGQGRLGATLTAGGATLSLASWLVPDTLSTIVAEIERDYAQFVTGDLTVELDDPLAAVRVWLAARGRADFELIITYAGAEALIFYGTVSADDLELLESGRWRVRVRDWSYSLRGKLVRDVWPPPGLTGDWPLLDVLDDVATALSLELVPGVPLHLHPDNISVFSQYRDRHYPAYGGDALCTRVVGGRSEADPDWLVIVFRPGDPDTEEFTWHYYAVSKTTGLVRELAAESYDPATGVRYPSGGPYQAFGYKIVKCARSAAGRYYYFWVGRYAFARIGSGAYTAPLLSHIFLFDSQTGAMRRIAGRDYYEAGAAWDDGTFRWWPIASTCDFSSRDGTVICAYERVATSGGMMLPFPHRISLLRFTLGRLSWSDLLAGNPFSVSQLTWNVAPTDADPVIYAGGGYYDDDGAAQQDRFCVVLLEKWQLWDTYAAYVFTWDRPTTSWTGFARTAIGLPTGAFRRWALAVRVGKAVIVDSISEGYFRLDLAPAWIEGGTHTRNFNFPSSLTLRYSSWVAADSPGPVRSAISLYTSGPDRWLQRITWDDVVGVVITRISQPDAAVPPAYEPTLWDVISVWSTRPRKSAPVPAVIDALGAIGFIAGRVALMYPAFPAVVNMDAAPATENLQEFLAACQEATGCFVRFLPGQLIAQTRTLGPAAAAYRFPTSLVLADGTELTRLTRQVVVVNGAGGAVGRWPAVPDPALDLGTFNVSSEYVPSTAVQVFARWLYEMLYEQFNWSLEADLDLPLQLETGDEIRLAVPAMELHGRVTRLNWPAPAPDTWGRARMRMAGVEVM